MVSRAETVRFRQYLKKQKQASGFQDPETCISSLGSVGEQDGSV